MRAPSQCVASTEITPSNGARISFPDQHISSHLGEILTIVNVGRFKTSDLCNIFFVGHNKLNAFPAGCWVIEYTSSAYSGRFPSATSHMPSRNFMAIQLEEDIEWEEEVQTADANSNQINKDRGLTTLD